MRAVAARQHLELRVRRSGHHNRAAVSVSTRLVEPSEPRQDQSEIVSRRHKDDDGSPSIQPWRRGGNPKTWTPAWASSPEHRRGRRPPAPPLVTCGTQNLRLLEVIPHCCSLSEAPSEVTGSRRAVAKQLVKPGPERWAFPVRRLHDQLDSLVENRRQAFFTEMLQPADDS